MSIDNQLSNIREKLHQLLKERQALQKENARLQSELNSIQEQSKRCNDSVTQLKQQLDIARMSTGNWGESEKREFEKKINQYVKEIDKCISFLSQ